MVLKTSDKVALKIVGLFATGALLNATEDSGNPVIVTLYMVSGIVGLIIMVSLVIDAVRAFKNRKKRREQES